MSELAVPVVYAWVVLVKELNCVEVKSELPSVVVLYPGIVVVSTYVVAVPSAVTVV